MARLTRIPLQAWVDECYRKRQHVNEELFLHNPDYVPAASSASSPPPAAVTATSSASTSSVTSTSSSSSSTSTSTSTPMLSPLPSYFKGMNSSARLDCATHSRSCWRSQDCTWWCTAVSSTHKWCAAT